MEEKSSITALMSAFGRAFHTENEKLPVFRDDKAKCFFSDDEYKAMCGYVLGGMDFFAPEKKGSFVNDKEALRYIANTQIVPTPEARAAFTEESLKTAVMTGTRQYVIIGAGFDPSKKTFF